MYPHPSFNPEQFTACYRAYTAALLDIQSETRAPPGKATCLTVALRIISHLQAESVICRVSNNSHLMI